MNKPFIHLVTAAFIIAFCLLLSFSTFALEDAIRFKITKSGSSLSDESVIRFYEAATTGFDSKYDAYKLFGSSPSIFTESSDGEKLSINAYPSLSRDYSLVVFGLNIGQGTYQFSQEVLGNFDDSVKIWVEDIATGEFYSRNELPLSFSQVGTSDTIALFKVYFSIRPIVEILQSACKNDMSGVVGLYDIGNSLFEYSIWDEDRLLVSNVQNQRDSSIISGLAAGEYTLKMESVTGEINLFKMTIDSIPSVSMHANIVASSCRSANDGSIHLDSLVGTGPFTITWDASQSMTFYLDSLTQGLYTASITDSFGCVTAKTLEILANEPELVLISLEDEDSTINIGDQIWLTNIAADATETKWELNGFYHTGASFSSACEDIGEYLIIVEGSDGVCTSKDSIHLFSIDEPLDASARISDLIASIEPHVWGYDQQLHIDPMFTKNTQIAILALYDQNGSVLFNQGIDLSQHTVLPITGMSSGIFQAVISTNTVIYHTQLFLN